MPEEKYYHDPSLKNKDGNTVAIILAEKYSVPPKEWEHDKFIKNRHNNTVAEILSSNAIIPS